MDKQKRYRVLKALLCETMGFKEVMRAYGIRCHEVPLNGQVAAFVYKSRLGKYHIFISTALSPEARREVFLHELYHIIEDMPKRGYMIGLDGYREPQECAADVFAEKMAATYF